MVKRHISDPRLRRVFTFQSLYAGVAPQHALAVYAVIAYMDTVSGVFFPRGGVRALPDALAAAGQDAGVRFRYGSAGHRARTRRRRGSPPCITEHGRTHCLRCGGVDHRIAAHLSSCSARQPRRILPLRAAPSAVVLHVGCRAASTEAETAHHNILFGDAWEHTFTDIIRDGQLMRDPSLLVTRPTASDASLAPAGRDLLYVLAPAPNLSRQSRRLDSHQGAVRADDAGRGAGTAAARSARRRRTTAHRHPRRLGPPGHGGRLTVRARPHVRADRAVPACQPRRAASKTRCWPDPRLCPALVCRPR